MKLERLLRSLPLHVILVLACILTVIPMLWMFSTAIKQPTEIFTQDLRLIPHAPTLENFGIAWNKVPFPRWLFNSLVTTLGITLSQLVTSLLAAFGFGYYQFRGKNVLFATFVSSMIVPFAVTMIPNYILISKAGLINTYWAVILPYTYSALGVFLFRQYMLTFPRDLFDAAKIDGANSWRILWQIVVPSLKAPIFAVGILFFLTAWNMYFWPLLVLTQQEMRTLPIGLQYFIDIELGISWGPFMAAATLISLPALLAYLLVQKHIINAYISSGIKG